MCSRRAYDSRSSEAMLLGVALRKGDSETVSDAAAVRFGPFWNRWRATPAEVVPAPEKSSALEASSC